MEQHAAEIGKGKTGLASLREETQAELQHVPSVLRLAPFRQLVHPGGIELRPAQGLWLMRAVGRRGRPVGPDQPPTRRLPFGYAVGGGSRQ